MEDKIYRMYELKWHVRDPINKKVEALCPKSICKNMPLELFIEDWNAGLLFDNEETDKLKCSQCGSIYNLKEQYSKVKRQVLDRIRSESYSNLKVKNLEDKPLISTKQMLSENSEYFVTASLKQSKLGPLLIIYAGKKGGEEKTQIFIEPKTKIVTYDKSNLDPRDIFVKVEVTFPDGAKVTIKK